MGTLPLCRRAPSDIPRCAGSLSEPPGRARGPAVPGARWRWHWPLGWPLQPARAGRVPAPAGRLPRGGGRQRQGRGPPAPKLRLHCLGAGQQPSIRSEAQ